jgi:hypothetical protein
LKTYVLAGQSVHGLQADAFSARLYEPAAQGEQARSVVALPERRTYVPGPHTDLSTHAVAGLRSSSHFSPVHATCGWVPPAQYSPLLQGAHAGGEVVVPGEVCVVPAGHWPEPRQNDWFTPLV